MARRRRNQKLLDIALESHWPVAAWIAAAFFIFGFLILPSILKSSAISAALVAVEQYGLGFLGLFFAGIALVKYLLQLSSRSSQASPIRPQKLSLRTQPCTERESVRP